MPGAAGGGAQLVPQEFPLCSGPSYASSFSVGDCLVWDVVRNGLGADGAGAYAHGPGGLEHA